MNPDVFTPFPVPKPATKYFRRIMIANRSEPVDFDVTIRATGYCYLGWTLRGRWQAWVNGKVEYDTETDGRVHLSGQIVDSDVRCRMSGPLQQVFSEMTAIGQYALFDIPGSDTIERAIPVPAGKSFAQPQPFDSDEALLESLKTAIDRLVAGAQKVPDHVEKTVARFEESDGAVSIAETAEHLDVSQRQLQRDFSKIVGLTPKAFCRTLQVNTALNALLALGDERLSQIAADSGYSDQAHMTRSFVEFLGSTPKAIVEGIEPTLAKFVGQSRQTMDGQ